MMPLGDHNPYQMPEDLKAFNEYWTQAEDRPRRQPTYEECNNVVPIKIVRPLKHFYDHED